MKPQLLLGLFTAFFLLSFSTVQAADLKIAVVDMQQALNKSKKGKRSMAMLLASKKQKESELKSEENELKKLIDGLKNAIMLTDKARAEKEATLRKKDFALRKKLNAAQQSLAAEERKLTQVIFKEIKRVAEKVGAREKYDLVLEKGLTQFLLFSRFKMTDITQLIIKQYDKKS